MCPLVDMCELRDYAHKGNLKRSSRGNLLKEERVDTTENGYRDEEYVLDTTITTKEIETTPAKTIILHTQRESTLLKAEGDSKKPWYFTHV